MYQNTLPRNDDIKNEKMNARISSCKIHLFCSTNAVKSSEGTESTDSFCTLSESSN